MKIKLDKYINEINVRNKNNICSDVYSVTNSEGFIESKEYFSKEVYSKDLSSYKIVMRNMMAYNPSRINVGSVAIQNKKEKVIVSPLYTIFSVNQDYLLVEYLNYFLHSDIGLKQIKFLTTGSVRDNLNFSSMKNLLIPIENIHTQKKRVEVLNKLDSLIKLKKIFIDKLNKLVRSLFIEMFGNPIKNSMNWNKEKLENKCQIITGNTPSRKIDNYYGSYIEWIKSDNIDINQSIITKAVEYLSEKGLKVGRCVDNNSILMTCIAGSIKCIGNVAVTNRKVAFNQQINAIVPNNQNVWFMYIQFKICQQYIQSSINMSLKGILSKSRLSELLFIFPPIELQEQFAKKVQQIDKSKLVIQQSLEKLEILKKSLMQEYFG